ncbi:MAG: S8 family peptidase [Castellaniella sp.]
MATKASGSESAAEIIARTRIANDLKEYVEKTGRKRRTATRRRMEAAEEADAETDLIPVIIEGNQALPGGAAQARRIIVRAYGGLKGERLDKRWKQQLLAHDEDPLPTVDCTQLFVDEDDIDLKNSIWTDHYLFASLTAKSIDRLASATIADADPDSDMVRGTGTPLVYKLWLNHEFEQHIYRSAQTIKASAARAAFDAAGDGVVWAVADTGIDGFHPHFRMHRTLDLPGGLQHHDFTGATDDALRDDNGHGTHVAGIIAGETRVGAALGANGETVIDSIAVSRKIRVSDQETREETDSKRHGQIAGIAPRCKLVSLKVMNNKRGHVSLLLAAIGYIQQTNEYGANLRIHGLNLSLGYSFDAEWFATGQSPLCTAVNRLVKSGVVVVVSAGNSGYGVVQTMSGSPDMAAHLASISDPGNADLAITVGSTHRAEPHTFGISYFSSKGPTADGRNKPDLVAPGERIVSCALYQAKTPEIAPFKEDTGTSMAAPHVSGGIAAFLSIHGEFKGQPEHVKRIFMDSATSLGRRAEFQGAGLIDLMRALQSV